MKVIHILTYMQKASGVSSFVAGSSAALCDNGIHVDIATEGIGASDQCPVDSRVGLFRLATVDRDFIESYDIIHIHGLWSPILHKINRICFKYHKPIVLSPHGGLSPWAMSHKWWKKFLPWHLYQKSDVKDAQLIHATSEQEARWISNLGFMQQIVVAPLGTNVREPDGPDMDTNTILFVGRVYPVKALDRLIMAFALVQTNLRNGWKLRIVGPDQAGYLKELKQLVQTLELEGFVEFPGCKYGQDLDAEYNKCAALALVSHTENFGSTVVEAMAHGKPCITSVFTPWSELQTFKCGWWVSNEPEKLAEALQELMSMPEERRREMGENGRKRVLYFYSWKKIAQKLASAYEQLKCERPDNPEVRND